MTTMTVPKAYYDGTWRKAVRHELVEREWGVNDLAAEVCRSRVHISQTLNGKSYSIPTIKAICNVLGVDDPETMDRQAEYKQQSEDDLLAAFEAMVQQQQ